MIYSHDRYHNSHIQVIQCMRAHIHDLHTKVWITFIRMQREHTEGALTLSGESITHSAAYFGGSKDHVPLCFRVLGHVLKMYQLTTTSVWYIRKTNADLHSPKEHFRHLHQKYPQRHKNRHVNWLHIFFLLLLQSDEIYAVSPKWIKVFYHSLTVFCWGEFAWMRQDLMRNPLFLIFQKWISKAAMFWRKTFGFHRESFRFGGI